MIQKSFILSLLMSCALTSVSFGSHKVDDQEMTRSSIFFSSLKISQKNLNFIREAVKEWELEEQKKTRWTASSIFTKVWFIKEPDSFPLFDLSVILKQFIKSNDMQENLYNGFLYSSGLNKENDRYVLLLDVEDWGENDISIYDQTSTHKKNSKKNEGNFLKFLQKIKSQNLKGDCKYIRPATKNINGTTERIVQGMYGNSKYYFEIKIGRKYASDIQKIIQTYSSKMMLQSSGSLILSCLPKIPEEDEMNDGTNVMLSDKIDESFPAPDQNSTVLKHPDEQLSDTHNTSFSDQSSAIPKPVEEQPSSHANTADKQESLQFVPIVDISSEDIEKEKIDFFITQSGEIFDNSNVQVPQSRLPADFVEISQSIISEGILKSNLEIQNSVKTIDILQEQLSKGKAALKTFGKTEPLNNELKSILITPAANKHTVNQLEDSVILTLPIKDKKDIPSQEQLYKEKLPLETVVRAEPLETVVRAEPLNNELKEPASITLAADKPTVDPLKNVVISNPIPIKGRRNTKNI